MITTAVKLTSHEVRALLAAAMEVSIDKISDSARFVGDVGVSSINAIAALLALEENFQVEISDEEAENLMTFHDVETFLVERKLIVN